MSGATVRNWVRAGHLAMRGRGQVCEASLKAFMASEAYGGKLKNRANKSKKGDHNHKVVTARFLAQIRAEAKPEKLGEAYENALSEAHRNKEGVYYTPEHIVKDLLDLSPLEIKGKSFCDPCCGSGNFLLAALELGFEAEQIYGFDVDPVAVEIARARVYDKTGYRSENIRCGDFLSMAISQKKEEFDYIFTNPPWGKKLEKEAKRLVVRGLGVKESGDTSALFYFACLRALRGGGALGLLLPEAFFNVAAYEEARRSVLGQDLRRLVHYGRPFKGLVTGAVGLVLRKGAAAGARVSCEYEGRRFERDLGSFAANPRGILNVGCTAAEAAVIERAFAVEHVTLRGRARWGLGIVTGDNGRHVKGAAGPGLVAVYRGADIGAEGLRGPAGFVARDFGGYQQVAPLELYEAPEKLIYAFISARLRFFCDREQRFILNSANMLVVEEGFPVGMGRLAELFNSDFMSWLFKKLFDTHKVLRGDLEVLPIHAQFLGGEEFSEEEYLRGLGVKRIGDGVDRLIIEN